MIKICKLCGKEYMRTSPRQLYCGKKRKTGCSLIMDRKRSCLWAKNNPEKIRIIAKRCRKNPKVLENIRESNRRTNKNRRLKLRFEILTRDNFTCQYCGRKAPEVELQIDHKYPKSKGGLNKIENYITSCRECNIGKGDRIINEFHCFQSVQEK